MSAFLVSDGTIDRVVKAFSLHYPDHQPDLNEIGRMMVAMNASALNQRYTKAQVEEAWGFIEPDAYTYTEHEDDKPNLAMLKALHCFIYQCSEGNVPDCDLYKRVQAVEKGLTEYVCRVYKCKPDDIYNVPDYNELPWDFD